MQYKLHATLSGNVQGVSFRAFAKQAAEKLGLKGFARNTIDGKVEIVAVGGKEKLEIFLSEVSNGPPMGKVEAVQAKIGKALDEFQGFEIR